MKTLAVTPWDLLGSYSPLENICGCWKKKKKGGEMEKKKKKKEKKLTVSLD